MSMTGDPLLDQLTFDLGDALNKWHSRIKQTCGPAFTDEVIADMARNMVMAIPVMQANAEAAYAAKIEADNLPKGVVSLANERSKRAGIANPMAPRDPNQEQFDINKALDFKRLARLSEVMGVSDNGVVVEALRRGVTALENDHGLAPLP